MENNQEIEIHYLKSNTYKSFFSTGVIGGIASNGLINMNFYIERIPLPKKIVSVIEGTVLTDLPEKTESKNGIIREVDSNIIIDVNVAIKLRDWLSIHIDILQDNQKKSNNE